MPSKSSNNPSDIRCLVKQDVLLFTDRDETRLSQAITIYNPFEYTINYTVKSTSPKRFTVRFPKGLLMPRKSIDVVIKVKGRIVEKEVHKFMVQVSDDSGASRDTKKLKATVLPHYLALQQLQEQQIKEQTANPPPIVASGLSPTLNGRHAAPSCVPGSSGSFVVQDPRRSGGGIVGSARGMGVRLVEGSLLPFVYMMGATAVYLFFSPPFEAVNFVSISVRVWGSFIIGLCTMFLLQKLS
eukprot:TRINITY_DN7170_c0_g1_i1.p1 TRINITY_DN7170_c0_g1~~TRINITY_DN7170_c0_g1_i1.p1  ORF type:complete len:241 (+),score=38.91 TRINITY_DN7170_c0_g1_i1:381-1103(+)